ncbi:MAG TPA: DUF4276 family protein [Saprospiraceae bacterium]|nr:DUF4276 family protein [Saprospiraceae bacterium]
MAVITIFIEGGVLAHDNQTIQTLDNSESLRESFYKLLTQKFSPKDFTLEIEIGGPNNQAIIFLQEAVAKNQDSFAIVDLDAPTNQRKKKISEFGINDENISKRIIFMVQEMEAWILSQPDKIESCFQYLKRRKSNIKLSDDAILKNRHPESINKPSDKLHTLLGRYFQIEKKGKLKKKKYKKLKDGADLLELLDYHQLEQVFSDVNHLSESLKNKL